MTRQEERKQFFAAKRARKQSGVAQLKALLPEGRIARQPVAKQSGGRGEWFYVYSVNGTSIGYSLKTAERWALRHGLRPVRGWEVA